jgi:hypothetical protein
MGFVPFIQDRNAHDRRRHGPIAPTHAIPGSTSSLGPAPRLEQETDPPLGLAPVVVRQLIGALKALKASGVTILLVEQNVHLTLALSDYAYVIAEGRPFCEGGATRSLRCRRSGRPISDFSLRREVTA